MKLVELTRQADEGTAEVMGAVGPLENADADIYAARLQQLIGNGTADGSPSAPRR